MRWNLSESISQRAAGRRKKADSRFEKRNNLWERVDELVWMKPTHGEKLDRDC
jgi:hypothetical protein